MSVEFTSGYLQEVKQDKTGDLDGPPCHVCGAIMVPQGIMVGNMIAKDTVTHWLCQSCGTTTGCS